MAPGLTAEKFVCHPGSCAQPPLTSTRPGKATSASGKVSQVTRSGALSGNPAPGHQAPHSPLQSFMRTIPKMCSEALEMGIGSPNLFPGPTKKAWGREEPMRI